MPPKSLMPRRHYLIDLSLPCQLITVFHQDDTEMPQTFALLFSILLQCSSLSMALTTPILEYTGFPLVDPSPLTVSDSAEHDSAFLCANWCFTKHKAECKLILFDSESKECKKVYGTISMSEREPSAKSLFFGLVKGEH